jgi:hypothetical protein
MDKTGRRTLHLYGLGGMFIFSIFITISFLIKASIGFHISMSSFAGWENEFYRRSESRIKKLLIFYEKTGKIRGFNAMKMIVKLFYCVINSD